MATQNRSSYERAAPVRPFDVGTSLTLLNLAQAALIVGIWIATWPSTFGVESSQFGLVAVLGFVFGLALIGFYVGFVSLLRPVPESM